MRRQSFFWILVVLVYTNFAEPTPADTITPARVPPALFPFLDSWSRADASLLPKSLDGPVLAPEDFDSAVRRVRPRATARAGSLADYQGKMSLRQATTLKGFTFEDSLARRYNLLGGPVVFVPGPAGHPYADLKVIDRATGRMIGTVQAYSGSNPRKALEKYLLTDRRANVTIVPGDVYKQIGQAIRECEALHAATRRGEISPDMARRQIERRAQKVGLQYDDGRKAIFIEGKGGEKRTLGHLGTKEINLRLARLTPDPSGATSGQIARDQLRLNLEKSKILPDLANLVKRNEETWQALLRGQGKLMALSLEEQSALNKAVKRAVLQGVSEKKITEILAQSLKEGQEATKAPLEAVVRLNQEASKAYQLQVWKGRAILMGFTFLGALADFALGPKNVEEWIRSGKLMEWGTRVGNSLLAMEAASLAEKQMRKKMEGQGGKETVRSLNPRIFRIRLVGLGTATVLFIAGEGLMAALQGEGSNEIGGRIGEAVLVLAIAEGSVMTAELLFAGEIGAFSGPVGIAIAIGVTALYEGGKHLWTARKEHDFDHRVFQARCEIAKQQITQWTDKTVGAVVRSTQQP